MTIKEMKRSRKWSRISTIRIADGKDFDGMGRKPFKIIVG
jgi:hypothetical protein